MIFRAIWPITDERAGIAQLAAQAKHDLPLLAGQVHAHLTGPGRFTVANSAHIPGSGRITPWVLIYECPARRRTPIRLVLPTTTQTPAAGAEGEAARQPAPKPIPTTRTSTHTSTGAAA